ncbi:Bacterial type II secretion system protein F domain protein [Pigmentiphaga humi]|uniref:Bacterial type II secretion system protein F domain protein n=1 Tax=Pigmentiphaga humi TaxID=2478468 RepID=A0A3P4B6N0_9BURK|nr:type II secretion system F family protein [Pigmentiphaga humi]VCU71581.1 Bacterial type II secretion system protein F domain protein [Pigmentiphaga humi]
MHAIERWGIAAAVALCAALLAVGMLGWAWESLARYRATFAETARVRMGEFFFFVDVEQLWRAQVLLVGALALAGGWLGRSWSLAAVGAVLGVWLPRRAARMLRGRRLRRFDAQLPDALLALACALRAGASLPAALRQLVAEGEPPLAQEFALMLREQRLGTALDLSLANLGDRMPTEAASLVVAALRIAAETGGNLADTLERIAATVRARLHMEGRVRALTAQGRLQSRVVGVLPWLLIAALHSLEPETMGLLWTTREGWAVLSLVAVLDLLGLWMIARIVRIDL